MVGGAARRGNAVDRAEADVAGLEAAVAHWVTDGSTAEVELEDLRGRVGDEVLDDATAAGRLTAKISELSARVDVAGAAADAATRRLEGARRVLLRARAAELGVRAAKLRDIAETRQEATDRLLVELQAWEGPRYAPLEPPRMSPGDIATVNVPFTVVLRDEAAELARRGDHLARVADDGDAGQVAGQAAAPVPPAGPAEALVLDDPSVRGERVEGLTRRQVHTLGIV